VVEHKGKVVVQRVSWKLPPSVCASGPVEWFRGQNEEACESCPSAPTRVRLKRRQKRTQTPAMSCAMHGIPT